jgi:hypothetical protein
MQCSSIDTSIADYGDGDGDGDGTLSYADDFEIDVSLCGARAMCSHVLHASRSRLAAAAPPSCPRWRPRLLLMPRSCCARRCHRHRQLQSAPRPRPTTPSHSFSFLSPRLLSRHRCRRPQLVIARRRCNPRRCMLRRRRLPPPRRARHPFQPHHPPPSRPPRRRYRRRPPIAPRCRAPRSLAAAATTLQAGARGAVVPRSATLPCPPPQLQTPRPAPGQTAAVKCRSRTGTRRHTAAPARPCCTPTSPCKPTVPSTSSSSSSSSLAHHP